MRAYVNSDCELVIDGEGLTVFYGKDIDLLKLFNADKVTNCTFIAEEKEDAKDAMNVCCHCHDEDKMVLEAKND